MKKIVVLVGLPASGKTTVAENLGNKMDIPVVETSPFVYKSVEEKGLPVTPENIKMVTTQNKSFKDYWYTEKAFEFCQEEYADKEMVFFAGMRSISEIKFLKEKLGREKVIVVGFHASQTTRFKRVSNPDRLNAEGSKAQEDKKLQNFDYFLAREEKELGFGVGSIFAMSDYIIKNDDLRYPYNSLKRNLIDFENIVKLFLNDEE
ncbi:MAG: AAA family ATPase [Candidatus Hodarchaeales archaeon]|jgi:dephospho-CoA kinase